MRSQISGSMSGFAKRQCRNTVMLRGWICREVAPPSPPPPGEPVYGMLDYRWSSRSGNTCLFRSSLRAHPRHRPADRAGSLYRTTADAPSRW